jgi:4-amino-4-deoxy-L-arabinose transferase-like glycosyltransferase
MGGTVHPYYAVALAPAIAALTGIGSVELWRGRGHGPARIVLAATVLAGSVWSAVLLGRDASWLPWIRIAVVVLGVLAAAALLARFDSHHTVPARFRSAAAAGVVVVSLLAGGLGSAAWTFATAAQPHSGSIPTSGPTASAMGGPGGQAGRSGTIAAGTGGADGGLGGPAGGGASSNSELTALLKSSTAKWSGIVSGASQAASLELATGTNVIALGGWNGGDPYPTLAQFQEMVANGEIGYFISGGGMGGGGMGGGPMGGGPRGGNSEVATWVAANFEAQTVGNSTVYKLRE